MIIINHVINYFTFITTQDSEINKYGLSWLVASVWDSRRIDLSSANHNLLPYRQLCVPVLHVTMFESELVQDVREGNW